MLEYFMGFFQDLRFADYVDIAIIAIFIYLILVWFKKARVRFILVGMIALGIVFFLVRWFGLYLTTMVFQAFFAIFLIIIVVLFQNDFRHFFERIAIWGITGKRIRKSSIGQDIDILSGGLANLSRKKIGALVVVRGHDPLDHYLEAGVHLDGLLNQVLLESIFDPHVPSHDGAVIVDGMRITKFGCYLPLSTNIQEVGRLGTRHAAALGLAEHTDALCLVVSEEQGTISVAEDGRLRQAKDIEELKHLLVGFFRRKFPKKQKRFISDFLTGHFPEKVIAIVLACSLWVAFGHRREIIRRDFVVPIEYRNLDSDRIIGEPKPKEITVTLSGSDRTFSLFDPKDLKLSLDMSAIKDGENNFPLSKDFIRKPNSLALVNIEPETIKLVVFKMTPVSVPVEVKTQGRLPPGVVLKGIKAEPLIISGMVSNIIDPRKLMVETEPVDLKLITETVTLTPNIIIPPEIRFPDNKPPLVKVIIEIEKK